MSDQYEEWGSKRFGRVITEDELSKRTHPIWPYKYFNPGKPVDKEKVSEILEGGIDIHLHGAPSSGWLPGRPTLVETAISASEAHMKGLVFKDLNGKVNNCAIIIQDMLDRMAAEQAKQGISFTPVQLFGGIVLNYPVGGINAAAVRSALEYGKCKMVWLPSSDAAHQYKLLGKEGGIAVSDGHGTLTGEMIHVLELLAEYHISSGNAVFVHEQLDKGLIDFGIIFGKPDLTKYNALKLPTEDVWGVLFVWTGSSIPPATAGFVFVRCHRQSLPAMYIINECSHPLPVLTSLKILSIIPLLHL